MTKEEKNEMIPSGHYDYVIDKACLDCLMTNGEDTEENFIKALNQINLCMGENSTFFYFSTGKPEKRISLITRVFRNCKIDIEEIGKNYIFFSFFFFFYYFFYLT